MFSAADERSPRDHPKEPRQVRRRRRAGQPGWRASTTSVYWVQALGSASSAVRCGCLCQVIWLAVISEGDLFALVIGPPSSLVVDGDVTYTSRPVGKARSLAPSSKGKRAVIEALPESGADPAEGCRRRSRPSGCSAWTIWSRSSRTADGRDARKVP